MAGDNWLEHAFPETTRWVDSNLGPTVSADYHQYLYAVDYHLNQAEESFRRASSTLHEYSPLVSKEKRVVIPLHFHPGALVVGGDATVRQVASAIDTGLVLMNQILEAGIAKTKVRGWGIRKDPRQDLRSAIGRKYGAQADSLIKGVDAAFNPIGYQLLREYRDWVTHRGAPEVIVPDSLYGPLPIPPEVRIPEDERLVESALRGFIFMEIGEKTTVRCRPFVPPVQSIINADSTNETRSLIPAGLFSGVPAEVHVKGVRMSYGSLSESRESYIAKNPVSVSTGMDLVAGEELERCTAIDYTNALWAVKGFGIEVLTGHNGTGR